MTYLIVKIFIYLLLAGGIGFAAGWLFRNFESQKKEERAQRAINDAKSKVPQLESMLRGRDEQIQKLKSESKARRAEMQARDQIAQKKERALLEQQREINQYKQVVQASTPLDFDDDKDDASDLVSERSQENAHFKFEL